MQLSVKYGENLVKGQMLTPLETSLQPTITFKGKDKLYTLIMYDRNASTPSKYYIHWVVVNIPGSNIDDGQTIFKYDEIKNNKM